jgi:hypothetical protein
MASGRDADLPLLVALRENNLELATTLLQHGANPSLSGKSRETPLYYTVKLRKFEVSIQNICSSTFSLMLSKMMELLLNYKADRNARSADGNSPLSVAVGISFDISFCNSFQLDLTLV